MDKIKSEEEKSAIIKWVRHSSLKFTISWEEFKKVDIQWIIISWNYLDS